MSVQDFGGRQEQVNKHSLEFTLDKNTALTTIESIKWFPIRKWYVHTFKMNLLSSDEPDYQTEPGGAGSDNRRPCPYWLSVKSLSMWHM